MCIGSRSYLKLYGILITFTKIMVLKKAYCQLIENRFVGEQNWWVKVLILYIITAFGILIWPVRLSHAKDYCDCEKGICIYRILAFEKKKKKLLAAHHRLSAVYPN